MNQNKVLNKVRVLLGLEVELESMKLEDGVTVIDAEAFEAGESVFVMTEDDQKIPLPIGEYTLEDGKMLVVSEEGLIAEMKDGKEEEKEEEVAPEVEEEVEAEAEAPVSEEAKPVKKTVESVVKETFFSEIEALVNENKELKSQLEELSRTEEVKEEEAVEEVKEEIKEEEAKEEVELSSEEAGAEPLAHNPEASEKRDMFKYASKARNNKLNSIFAKMNK
tara:strand:- start:13 stop:675 length:663 start_codon:yes stop_codon:yes gene_type:complete